MARLQRKENPSVPLVGVYIGTAAMQNIMEVPQKKKLKMEVPHDPAILLLGIYPKEMELLSKRDNCTPMFTGIIFTTVKT